MSKKFEFVLMDKTERGNEYQWKSNQGKEEPQHKLPNGSMLAQWNKIHKKKGMAIAGPFKKASIAR